jgi:hypothetical protein
MRDSSAVCDAVSDSAGLYGLAVGGGVTSKGVRPGVVPR